MASPIDIATQSTADFICKHVAAPADILEIGCGAGEVATDLMRRGHTVTGIDPDPDCVTRARQRGVTAVEAEFNILESASVPYLYRYLIPVLPDTDDAANSLNTVLQLEQRLGSANNLVLIGRRMVARSQFQPRGQRMLRAERQGWVG